MSLHNKNPSILPEPVLRSRENGSVPVSRLGNESLVTWKSWILTGNAELGPDAHFTMSGHVADLIHFPPWTISQSCQVWWIEREIHFPSGSRNLATFQKKKLHPMVVLVGGVDRSSQHWSGVISFTVCMSHVFLTRCLTHHWRAIYVVCSLFSTETVTHINPCGLCPRRPSMEVQSGLRVH